MNPKMKRILLIEVLTVPVLVFWICSAVGLVDVSSIMADIGFGNNSPGAWHSFNNGFFNQVLGYIVMTLVLIPALIALRASKPEQKGVQLDILSAIPQK